MCPLTPQAFPFPRYNSCLCIIIRFDFDGFDRNFLPKNLSEIFLWPTESIPILLPKTQQSNFFPMTNYGSFFFRANCRLFSFSFSSSSSSKDFVNTVFMSCAPNAVAHTVYLTKRPAYVPTSTVTPICFPTTRNNASGLWPTWTSVLKNAFHDVPPKSLSCCDRCFWLWLLASPLEKQRPSLKLQLWL